MSYPGLELLIESVQHGFKAPSDKLICLVHWNLISEGYKCISVGEDVPPNKESAKGSEKLPRGWNSSQDLYSMVYKKSPKEFYTLKVIKMDNNLLVNFMRVSDEKVVTMDIRISHYSSDDMEDFENMFHRIDQFNGKMNKDIFSKLKKSPSSPKASKSRPRHSDDPDPLRVPSRHPGSSHHRPEPGSEFDVGGRDLDPFGGGRGGMFMDPMRSGPRGAFRPDLTGTHPGQLPRGSVPPGARFDPFGPPGMRPGPDPDHERPPDYDDMFM